MDRLRRKEGNYTSSNLNTDANDVQDWPRKDCEDECSPMLSLAADVCYSALSGAQYVLSRALSLTIQALWADCRSVFPFRSRVREEK